MFSLEDKREILIAATNEVLQLSEETNKPIDLERRRAYVREASRLAGRLLDVQKEIEEHGDK
jgi:hypothetical protein